MKLVRNHNFSWKFSLKIKLMLLVLGLLGGAGGWNLVSGNGWSVSAEPSKAKPNEPMPSLQGQPAIDYLKRRGLFESVNAAVAADRHEIQWLPETGRPGSGGSWQAINSGQKLQASFSRAGTLITPRQSCAGASWQVRMSLLGVGYGERLDEVVAGPMRVTGNRIESRKSLVGQASPTITEWYVNKAEGIEQGFTLAVRPGETFGNEMLRVALSVTGGLQARLEDGGQAVALTYRDGRQALRYDHLAAYDALGRSLPARMEVREGEISLLVDDAKAVYPVTIDPLFTEVKKLTASDGVSGDAFGYSVALSDDTAIIGAYGDDGLKGSAYIFARNQGGANLWGEVKKLTASDGAVGDFFGGSVALSGDTAIVGAFSDDNLKGSAYIFARNQGGANLWGEVIKLTASDGVANGAFGRSVGISGDTAIVGAPGDNGYKGAAYVFDRNNGGADLWGEVKKLTASDGAVDDIFGSVAISGDTAIVGASGGDNSGKNGAAYVFERNQGGADQWGEVKKLTASDGAANDAFGRSVGLSGDTAIVGAFGDDGQKGSAYIYTRNQGGANIWGQVKKLAASDGAANDAFGQSVGISGDTAIVGAWHDDFVRGSSYVFERNQGGADLWGEVKKLTASDRAQGDLFGFSVAISGGTTIIGAYNKDSQKGATYIFASDCNWVEKRKPVASDGVAEDLFGYLVAISGDTAIVGAYGDDNFKGSAYIFERNKNGADLWGQVKKLIASDGVAGDQFGISVGISGDTAIVGGNGDNDRGSASGSAYIFERNKNGPDNWGQVKKLTALDGAALDHFGIAVALSGDTAIVGAFSDDGDKGSAYIFERNKNGADLWGQVKKLVASDGGANDEFGYSVGLSGDTAIIGAYGDDSQKGSAYVFERNKNGADFWGEVKKLFASDGAANDQFGASVGISGGNAIVGAAGNDNIKGAAYVYSQNQAGADQWGEVKKLTASAGEANDGFGVAVGISGDTALISAPNDDSLKGSAFIFERNQGGPDFWGEVKKLSASENEGVDCFGCSVGISDDTAIIGAFGDEDLKGLSYIFVCDPNAPQNTPPTINPQAVTRSEGASGTNSTIANVNDAEDAENSLAVTINGATITGATTVTVNGVTISNVAVNTVGVVTANVMAACGASNASFMLKVTDSGGLMMTTTLNVTVTANTPPVLSYATQTVNTGTMPMFNPATGPSDNGSVTSISLQSVTPMTGLTLSVNNTTGDVTVTEASLSGSYMVVIRASDNCAPGVGTFTEASFTVNVICPTITLPTPLPSGFQGATYNQVLTAIGGSLPHSFTVSTGTLPDGLNLSVSGVLSGVPTTTGTFSFTVQAADANNCTGTRSYTVIISGTGLMFYPLAHPIRLLDTRAGQVGCDAPGAPIAGGTSRTQTARRTCDGLTIPANAQAITGNITTVQSGGGYLTLYPSDAAQPLVANSNYSPNEILNNVFTVGLGASDGAFKIFVTSNTDVVVDVTGYYAPPGAGGLYFHPLPKPIRLLETRAGFTGCSTPGTALPGNVDTVQQARLTCDGVTIPETALAIVGNATTVSPQGPGFPYLTLFPADAARPLVASSNYLAEQVMNAPFTVGLSPAGGFKIYPTTQTHLIIDVLGYYSTDAVDVNGTGLLFNPLSRPVRLLETRAGLTGCDAPGAPLLTGSIRTQLARGVCDGVTIATNALGIVGNATVVNSTGGFLTFWPSSASQPLVATSNFASGQVFNRHFTVGLGAGDGAFNIFTQFTTDLVIDVSGYFAP